MTPFRVLRALKAAIEVSGVSHAKPFRELGGFPLHGAGVRIARRRPSLFSLRHGRSAVSRGKKGRRGIQAHTHIRSTRRVWNLEAPGGHDGRHSGSSYDAMGPRTVRGE